MSNPQNQAPIAYPPILHRYVTEVANGSPDVVPIRVVRRFHNLDVPLWRGRVHVDDIHGWVQNIRIRHYLNRWREKKRDSTAVPTSDDIYEIMVEADKEEESDKKRPFHIERIAENIARNGVQEPVILFASGNGRVELWDGNRRFFGTKHLMRDQKFAEARTRAQWLPAEVYLPSGDPTIDQQVKHCVLTEMNFVEKDHIPWPAYVKAGQIFDKYHVRIADDPTNPTLSKNVKAKLAEEYGLKGWRVADRWIKMYELAERFKEYQEEEHNRAPVEIDLKIQDRFEYFDELSKSGVWGVLRNDVAAQNEVFSWLWDDKFQNWPDVRLVPQILANPVAREIAKRDYKDAVRDAVKQVFADDPAMKKDKRAAGEKIKQFAEWLNSFKREDFKGLDPASLSDLEGVLRDVVAMLKGLQAETTNAE